MTGRGRFTLLQLSDPHLGATWTARDPYASLCAAVEAAPKADAILVSGDLAEHAADDEYRQLAELLGPLGASVHVLPGNHDDRAALRRTFDVPGTGAEPVHYAAALGRWRLVVVDSTRPGEDGGELTADRLALLDETLADALATLTIVAMHHPPLVIGSPAWDEIGVSEDDRRALADLLARHPQVRRIVAGHLHQTVVGELAGRTVLAAPSTYVQARLEPGATELHFADDPPAFVVHTEVDGDLASHVRIAAPPAERA
jgi:3',5'-cyclic AMP phosphodiesterase CpdA